MAYYLIDSPVSHYSNSDEIREWIKELEQDFPQENEQVQYALEQARKLLKET